MNKISKITFQLIKKTIPPRLKDRLATKFLGHSKIFDPNEIRTFQLNQSSHNRLVSNKDFLPNLFNAFYGNIDANCLVPDADLSCAQSFVPYYKGLTNLVLYNFFSRNYGIRDPILYRFVALNRSNPVFMFNKILAADQVVLLGDVMGDFENKKLPEHGSILVQAFHPRIKTPADQLRFLAIYHGVNEGVVSGIHSMQLPLNGIGSKWDPSFRSYGFSNVPAYISTCLNVHEAISTRSEDRDHILSRLYSKRSLIGQNAYLTLEKEGRVPLTIWHDGPVAHSVGAARNKKKLGPCRTAFFVPDFEFHAPILFFSESQIGFQPDKITISAFDEKQNLFAAVETHLKTAVSTVDLKTLFSSHPLSGGISFVVDFKRDMGEFEKPPQCYIHIYYRSKDDWGDQVHSDSTIGYKNDPLKKPKSYRCRKFAPFIKSPQLKFIYSVINVGGFQPNADASVNIRIISDKKVERVVRFEVPAEGIATIDAELLMKAIDYQIDRAAIVQLEHETTNFNGMWFCIDQKTHHLGVDHFTGG